MVVEYMWHRPVVARGWFRGPFHTLYCVGFSGHTQPWGIFRFWKVGGKGWCDVMCFGGRQTFIHMSG